MEKFWKCPKCKRIFKRNKQQHSCAFYPVEKHLERKDYAKELYNILKSAIRSKIGSFTVESLPCCIHFVNREAYTFAAVYALKDGIKLHIASKEPPKNTKTTKMSSVRYLYSINIKDKKEINSALMRKIKQAYNFKN